MPATAAQAPWRPPRRPGMSVRPGPRGAPHALPCRLGAQQEDEAADGDERQERGEAEDMHGQAPWGRGQSSTPCRYATHARRWHSSSRHMSKRCSFGLGARRPGLVCGFLPRWLRGVFLRVSAALLRRSFSRSRSRWRRSRRPASSRSRRRLRPSASRSRRRRRAAVSRSRWRLRAAAARARRPAAAARFACRRFRALKSVGHVWTPNGDRRCPHVPHRTRTCGLIRVRCGRLPRRRTQVWRTPRGFPQPPQRTSWTVQRGRFWPSFTVASSPEEVAAPLPSLTCGNAERRYRPEMALPL